MEYDVNKGVGKQVEFKGLTAMYLFILAGGLAAVLLAVVVLYLAGAGQWTCILGGIFAGGKAPSALPDPAQKDIPSVKS